MRRPSNATRPLSFKTRAKIAGKRFVRLFGGKALFAAIIVVLGLMITSAIVVYFAERGSNPEVNDIGDGFAWLIQTMITSSPFEVETSLGQVAFYTVEIVKPGLLSLITGAIASQLVQVVLKRNAGLGSVKLKDHIVICGWSSKGSEIIREIRGRDDFDRTRPLVLLAPLKESPTTDEFTRFISGDPSKAEDLRRAGIEHAQTAIILADNSYPGIDMEEMDAKTLLTVLAVETVNPLCYTCVEIIHSESGEHFERTKADEMLISGRVTGAMLAHSAVTHGLTRVINELISYPAGNEFYWVNAGTLTGKSFTEAVTILKGQFEAIPIAVATGPTGVPDVNPASTRVLEAQDRLLVIAPEEPKLV